MCKKIGGARYFGRVATLLVPKTRSRFAIQLFGALISHSDTLQYLCLVCVLCRVVDLEIR